MGRERKARLRAGGLKLYELDAVPYFVTIQRANETEHVRVT
jgi:hypothetical protein